MPATPQRWAPLYHCPGLLNQDVPITLAIRQSTYIEFSNGGEPDGRKARLMFGDGGLNLRSDMQSFGVASFENSGRRRCRPVKTQAALASTAGPFLNAIHVYTD